MPLFHTAAAKHYKCNESAHTSAKTLHNDLIFHNSRKLLSSDSSGALGRQLSVHLTTLFNPRERTAFSQTSEKKLKGSARGRSSWQQWALVMTVPCNSARWHHSSTRNELNLSMHFVIQNHNDMYANVLHPAQAYAIYAHYFFICRDNCCAHLPQTSTKDILLPQGCGVRLSLV